MTQTVHNFINGQWVPAQSGETFPSYNPATAALLAQAAKSSPADVDAAVEAARNAYKNWRLTPAPRRGEILFKVAQILTERKEELSINVPISCGGVVVEPGDFIVADTIGVVVIPQSAAEDVLAKAREQADREAATRLWVKDGKTIDDLLNEFGRL